MIMYGSLHDVAAANSSYIPNCTLAVWYYYFFTKVRKIAPIFYLDFSSIYLIKEFDNQAVFPGQSGRFNPSQIDPYYSYE